MLNHHCYCKNTALLFLPPPFLNSSFLVRIMDFKSNCSLGEHRLENQTERRQQNGNPDRGRWQPCQEWRRQGKKLILFEVTQCEQEQKIFYGHFIMFFKGARALQKSTLSHKHFFHMSKPLQLSIKSWSFFALRWYFNSYILATLYIFEQAGDVTRLSGIIYELLRWGDSSSWEHTFLSTSQLNHSCTLPADEMAVR